MQQYTSNAIKSLTSEQRKALAQCLILDARPADILAHTQYVLIAPTGDLELTAQAGQDWLKLHQEGLAIDPVTGDIVAQPTATESESELTNRSDGPFAWNQASGLGSIPMGNLTPGITGGHVVPPPFTAAQERRIREIVADVLRGYADSAEDAE